MGREEVTLGVLPSGKLGLVADPELGGVDAKPALSQELLEAFGKSSAAGLTLLASSRSQTRGCALTGFWRAFGRSYFRALCRQSSQGSAAWSSPDPPGEQELMEILESAPPMVGLEYLKHDSLQRLWMELDEYTHQQVSVLPTAVKGRKVKGDLAAYLRDLDSEWNLVGRVTFHLAENKKNPSKPFAFLATYTDDRAKTRTLQHIPLSEALKQSIQSGDTERLDRLLQPVSRAAGESDLVKKLLESRALFSPQAWSIGQAFAFLSAVPAMERAGVVVRVPNWWNASRPPRPQVSVSVGNRRASTLGAAQALDFQVGVALDGEPLSSSELAKLLEAREGLALLRGKWVQVDQERLQAALEQWQELEQQHADGLGFLEGMRLLSGAMLPEEQLDEEVRKWTRIQPGPWLEEMMSTLRDPSGHVALEPSQRLKATLRPYQADGLRWLWFAQELGLGVCLADDMGLGKTIQVIALLLEIKFPGGATPEKKSSPSLLVLPTSLLGNWTREVERFAPDLKLFVAHRSVTDGHRLKEVVSDPQGELSGFDLVVTTYGLARRDKWLHNVDWRLVILDEAQAIKNAASAQTRAIKKISARGRIALTGTPIENHLGDVWSLFDFCSPGLLGTSAQFKKFVKASEHKGRTGGLASLRRLIQPYVLRRMKTDPAIAPDLPNKIEMRVDCGLSATQAALYQQTLDDLEHALDVATGIQRRGIVLSALMQLKQICNHPALFLKQPDFDSGESGKYSELGAIAWTLMQKQEKMLVFTQFQSMCDPLRDFLSGVFRRDGRVLSGKTAATKRSKLVTEFQQESGPPFMVISVKAGGTGLNLTEACHVVHFDRWWNPAVEDQATDRAFRIGQKRNVMVHKFVCRGTLEEKIDDLLASKKQLSEELFGKEGEINLTEMSNEQLMKFVSLDLNKATSA